MSKELAFAIINPHTIAKSRTGGVLARYVARTQLNLVAARMFQPSRELADAFADQILNTKDMPDDLRELFANYVRENYGPDNQGRLRRVMFLLFEGEHACKKVWEVTGGMSPNATSGKTIRDTYGDYVLDPDKTVRYFEPAVMVAPDSSAVEATLKLWAKYSKRDGGICDAAGDVFRGGNVHHTLVLLKPDNFRFASLRPGNIVDLLSHSGLRIVALKKFNMTVAQAEKFYGPVKQVLEEKMFLIHGKRIGQLLAEACEAPIPEDALKAACVPLAPVFANGQFERIVEFMTGFKPSEVAEKDKATAGKEACLALVYQGPDAVTKIRKLQGSTDPSKAEPGSVRREFGSDIMVNAAHASDSPENAQREMDIIKVAEDTLGDWVKKYY